MSTNPASPPDPVRRRGALQTGLESVLSPLQVQAALRLWDEHYASARAMALAEYVAQLSQQLDYSVLQRHALRVAVYHAVSKYDVPGSPRAGAAVANAAPPPAGSKPVVAGGPVPSSAPTPPPAPLRSAAYVVFVCMGKEILANVVRDGPSATQTFADALQRHSDALRTKAEHGLSLRSWAQGDGSLEPLAELADTRLGLLIHAMFAAAAEALGPTTAKRVLAHAARVAETLPEALQFPPRRLL